MSSNIYKIGVDCSIGGCTIDVSSIRIRLAPNAIPSVLLTISPYRPASGIHNVTAGGMLRVLKDASKFVGKYNSSLKITLTPLSGGGPADSISLSGWRMVGIGLTNLGAAGQLGVQVKLEHPGSGLNSALPGAAFDYKEDKNGPKFGSGGSAQNMLDAYRNALVAWVNNRSTKNISKEQIELLDRIRNVVRDLTKLVTWGTYAGHTGFPLAKLVTPPGKIHPLVIYRQIANTSGPSSVWRHMTELLLTQYQLTVLPDYTKGKLTMGPYAPWGEERYTIKADQISNITMPAADLAPVAGARVALGSVLPQQVAGSYTGQETADQLKKVIEGSIEETENRVNSDVSDQVALIEGETEGAILTVECPVWMTPEAIALNSMFSADPAGNFKFLSVDETLERRKADLEARAKIANDKLKEAAATLSAAELCSVYRQSREVVFNTCLMFNNNGKTVIPGYRGSVADESGSDAFSFYLSGLEHCIDVAGNNAYTTWYGSYTAVKGDPIIDKYMSEPHPNPLYT